MNKLRLTALLLLTLLSAAGAEVADPSATPVATPTAAPTTAETSLPVATSSPVATPSPVESPSTADTSSPAASPTPAATESPGATSTPVGTASPVAISSPSPSSSPSASPTLLDHHWVVDERQSAMDDSTTITFSLLGVRDSASDQPTNDLLIARWREGKWDVMVSTNHEYLGDRYPTVMARWDQTPAETSLWLSSSDFTAAFCPTPSTFIERASKSSKLVVRLFPKFAGESTVVFDLTGLTAELEKYPKAKASLSPLPPAKKTK